MIYSLTTCQYRHCDLNPDDLTQGPLTVLHTALPVMSVDSEVGEWIIYAALPVTSIDLEEGEWFWEERRVIDIQAKWKNSRGYQIFK